MNIASAKDFRNARLDAALIAVISLAAGLGLATATFMDTKWMVFVIFILVAASGFLIVQEREKLLLYLSVFLTSIFLGFHPIYIETEVLYYPISGFRITIFEVAFFLLFISWLLRLVMNPSLRVQFFPWVTLPFLLLWVWSLAGEYDTPMPGVVKFSNMWLLLESWLIFIYFANNVKDRRMLLHIVAVLVLTGVLQSFLGLVQHVSGSTLGLGIFGESKSQKVMAAGTELISRVAGTFGHPNSLAGYLVMLVLTNLALFWAPISHRLKMWLFPAFILISGTLMLTYSRGGWLALGFGSMFTLYFCLLRWTRHKFVSFMITFAVIVTFFIASVGLITPLRNRLFLEDYGAARSRLPLAQVALNIIYHKPLMGVGLGNYLFAAPDYDISREGITFDFPRPVHNEFLLIAAEQGLPALALVLMIIGYIVIQLLRVARSREQSALPYIAIGLAGTFFAWAIFRFTDYNYVLLGDPLWLLAGLSMALVKLHREGPEIHPPSLDPRTRLK